MIYKYLQVQYGTILFDGQPFLASLAQAFRSHYKIQKFVNFSRNLSFQCLLRFDYIGKYMSAVGSLCSHITDQQCVSDKLVVTCLDSSLITLTLKAPITTAAADIHIYFFILSTENET